MVARSGVAALAAAFLIGSIAQAREPVAPLFGPVAIKAAQPTQATPYYYGASMYPEIESWDTSMKMLDALQGAGVNTVRVAESAWSHLEPRDGEYDFGWLRRYLDELHRRGMSAVIGTNSYIAPQWLVAKNPEMLAQYSPGVPVNPMVRKAASIHSRLYRQAIRRFLGKFAAAFKDHPAVIGWQLDNEIDAPVIYSHACTLPVATTRCGKVDVSEAARTAFAVWLRQRFGTATELNRRWGLRAWGLEVASLDDVRLPSPGLESSVPVIDLAYQYFLRDETASFLGEMKQVLHAAGVQSWTTSNFQVGGFVGLDPKVTASIDFPAVNLYPFSTSDGAAWSAIARSLDETRASNDRGQFLITETQFNRIGDTSVWDALPPEQARMKFQLANAYGAAGYLFWSGDRFVAGHWPQWGALFDARGEPEVDFEEVAQLGNAVRRFGPVWQSTTVSASAAVISDFDQFALRTVYPSDVPGKAEQGVTTLFEAFHRLGIGVDGISLSRAATLDALRRYQLVVVAAPAIADRAVVSALRGYAAQGGTVVVMPFTDAQAIDGVYRSDGGGPDMRELIGATIATERYVPAQKDADGATTVVFKGQPLAIAGLVQIAREEQGGGGAVSSRYRSSDRYIDKTAAIITHAIGRGAVYRFNFWPEREQAPLAIQSILQTPNPFFSSVLPAAGHAVPRSDGSMMIVNTSKEALPFTLKSSRIDRLTGRTLAAGPNMLKTFETVWLQK